MHQMVTYHFLCLRTPPTPHKCWLIYWGDGRRPLVVGLVLGRLRRSGPFIWALPFPAATALNQLGILLFLAYAGVDEAGEVPDPYYGPTEGFDVVLNLIERAVPGVIERLPL